MITREGISPYELSESEKYVLQSFNMEDTAQIITFNAPKETKSLKVNMYRLSEGGQWKIIGDGAIFVGEDIESAEQMKLSLAMK